ncbi:unnamed protein product [Cutaneotrichosporon oleaginosum]
MSTMTAPTLFTLPPHLQESIAALVAADVAPARLQDDLRAALAAAGIEEMEESDVDAEPTDGPSKPDEPSPATAASAGSDAGSEPVDVKPPRRKPPTIGGELLDALAAWAGSARDRLVSAGLDYSFIGLLAGTEVYLPPRQRALAAAADKALADREKANPFLPTYMSPTPPSLGSEYRQMSRQVATVLNVLFSIFGVGGGVYYAARSVGWARERAILLGILAGVVVGIADSVLLWIFKVRLKKDRRDTARRRVRLNKGSAGIPGSAKVLSLGGEGEGEGEGESEVIAALEEVDVTSASASASTPAKRTLRLRRKPLS